ncbi:MAG: hypothetical protein K0S38_377 [Candidatus Paceibacter sp.]|jgi:hypothetical protein|nr:hypothetical protein [Candidatus Paceibacter sp.]
MVRKILFWISGLATFFAPVAIALAQVDVTTSGSQAAANAGFGIFMVVYIAVLVLMLVSLWKIFSKAGKPGWAAIIPIYNSFVMIDVAKRPMWWFILLLIPFVNIIITIILMNDISRYFGKSTGFTIGLVFLPFIFMPILAFSDAQYQAPAGDAGMMPPPQPPMQPPMNPPVQPTQM